jgi:hypothetical protein
MRSDDVTGNTEPESHPLALTLRGEKWGKDLLQMLWGDAWTCIGNFHPEVLSDLTGLDAEFARGAIFCHGLTGIIEDMQKHLLELWGIELNRRQIWREISLDFNVAGAQIVGFPFQGFGQDIVQVLRMFVWPRLFHKGQKIPHRIRGALRLIEDAQGRLV